MSSLFATLIQVYLCAFFQSHSPFFSLQNGEHVIENQDICIVEAMKMQNVIRAPRSGVIKKLHAKEGSSMMADEIIVEFEKND